jgi:hypothetical protein
MIYLWSYDKTDILRNKHEYISFASENVQSCFSRIDPPHLFACSSAVKLHVRKSCVQVHHYKWRQLFISKLHPPYSPQKEFLVSTVQEAGSALETACGSAVVEKRIIVASVGSSTAPIIVTLLTEHLHLVHH